MLHALMNESLNVIGIAVLPLIAGLLVLAPIWPSSWPLVFQLLLAILISDIGITLAHFASHRLRFLWRKRDHASATQSNVNGGVLPCS